MDKLYPQAIIEHATECTEQLNELSNIIAKRPLSNHEYRASERLLQLLIESAIGAAKHCLKSFKKTSPTDAYQCFTKLMQQQFISEAELVNWKKVIGLRNVLVHDYLNIDPVIVTSILKDRHYTEIHSFIGKACHRLSQVAE